MIMVDQCIVDQRIVDQCIVDECMHHDIAAPTGAIRAKLQGVHLSKVPAAQRHGVRGTPSKGPGPAHTNGP